MKFSFRVVERTSLKRTREYTLEFIESDEMDAPTEYLNMYEFCGIPKVSSGSRDFVDSYLQTIVRRIQSDYFKLIEGDVASVTFSVNEETFERFYAN